LSILEDDWEGPMEELCGQSGSTSGRSLRDNTVGAGVVATFAKSSSVFETDINLVKSLD
jgi:hypothetical protein